ncbi:hypothetical protein Tco_0797104 [Tanacetum coccineum]
MQISLTNMKGQTLDVSCQEFQSDEITNDRLVHNSSRPRNSRPLAMNYYVLKAGFKSCSSSRQDTDTITTRNIQVTTYVLTMKMEILLEPASNKLLVAGNPVREVLCIYLMHRIHKDGDGDASFQLKSDSLPHAHAQTTKTYYKHQIPRIMKVKNLKTKDFAQN